MREICSNCDKYPLCEKCEQPTGRCGEWSKKDRLVKEN